MVTLLYHARANGAICKRIAAAGDGKIRAICDKDGIPPIINGTLVRWDSTAEVEADRTVNSAEAVRLSRNKRDSRLLLGPLAPETWIHSIDCDFPCVVRPKRHYGGRHFFLCNTVAEVKAAIRRCGAGKWYAARYIDKESEFRVFISHGKVFKVVRRYRTDNNPAVAWNYHNGGLSKRVKKESWPKNVVDAALAAAAKFNLMLCAVDVMVDAAGRAYVLEANTAPGLDRDKTIKRFAKLLGEMA